MALKVALNCLRYLNVNNNSYNGLNRSMLRVLFVNKHYSIPFRIRARPFSDDLQLGVDAAAGPKKIRAKTVEEDKIVLLDNEIYITTTMEHARKLAKSKSMTLVPAKNAKGTQKTFELVPISKILDSDKTKKETGKSKQKSLMISSKISDHDLETKIKHINKVLAKQVVVNVVIQKDKTEKEIRTIWTKIENGVKELGVIDEKFNASNPKFHILPLQPGETPKTKGKKGKEGTESDE